MSSMMSFESLYRLSGQYVAILGMGTALFLSSCGEKEEQPAPAEQAAPAAVEQPAPEVAAEPAPAPEVVEDKLAETLIEHDLAGVTNIDVFVEDNKIKIATNC